MSLLVWLPLNGNIKNQGLLGNVQFTNSGGTTSESGKIGSCYNLNGSSRIYGSELNKTYPLTASVWFKPTNVTSSTQYILACSTSGGSSDISIGIAIYQSKLACVCGGNIRSTSITPVNDSWYHVTVVATATSYNMYVDGVNTISGTYSSSSLTSPNINIGCRSTAANNSSGSYYFTGLVNDVRIYDHALSPLEVKELAKGLICHYTLASNSLSRINKATMNVTSWTNSSSAGEYIEKDTSYIGMQNVVSITSAGGQRGIYLGADTPLVSGKHYLCSCMVYFHGSDSQTEFFLRKDTSTSNHKLAFLAYNGETNCSLWPRDRWIYVYCVYTADADYNVARLCTYVQTNGAKKSFTAWKIEEIGTGTAYDSSGYSNNCSVISGGQLTISSDTPRYDSCCEFNGNTRLSCTSPTDEAKSASVWVYIGNTIPGTNSDNGVVFADYKSKLALGFGSSGIITQCIQAGKIGARTGINTNAWNHFCVVNNGTDNILYTNGQPVTMSSSNYWGHSTDTLIVGGRSTSNAIYSGKLSDFRLYSTVLSQQDVTDLYNMGCLVSQ